MTQAGSARFRSPRTRASTGRRGVAPRPPSPRGRRRATSSNVTPKHARDLVMTRVRVQHLVPWRQVRDRAARRPSRRRRARARSFSVHGSSAPMLKTWFHAARLVDRLGHQRRDVVDVAEGARLRAVAEDRHRLALQDLVHEDADDVAVAVADVLARAVDVVRPEDHVVEAEHLAAGARAPARRRTSRCRTNPRARRTVSSRHRQLRARAVHGDRRREDEALDAGVDGGVDQVDAADDVVRVVEPLDEVAEAFGGVGRQMIDVVEARRRRTADRRARDR